jgi:hypothetical protein
MPYARTGLQHHRRGAGDAAAERIDGIGRYQRLAAHHAMRIGKREPHRAELRDPLRNLCGGLLLLLRP